MATMKQIAQLAGVSRGTVDRVLNNRGAVNDATAQKIREIAQSLQYVPSRAAKSLAALRLNIRLGYILFPGETNPFFGQVEQGLRKKAAELAEYGVTVDIAHHDFSNQTLQDELLDKMANDGVNGIVLCGFNTEKTAEKINELARAGIPLVTANSDIPDSDRLAYVGSNHLQSGRAAANLVYLISGGNARVGMLFVSHNMLCHEERITGFQDYIAEKAPEIHVISSAENNDDDFESFSVVKNMLTEHPDINVLYLASAGVYGACRAVESFPPQLRPKIISYDCVPSTELMLRKGIICATICQQPDYQGSKPLDILFNKLAMNADPSRKLYFTSPDIRILENL